MNNDCVIASEAICQLFPRVTQKIIGESYYEWSKDRDAQFVTITFHTVLVMSCFVVIKNKHVYPPFDITSMTMW